MLRIDLAKQEDQNKTFKKVIVLLIVTPSTL